MLYLWKNAYVSNSKSWLNKMFSIDELDLYQRGEQDQTI